MAPNTPDQDNADRDEAAGNRNKPELAELLERLHAMPPAFEDESLAPEVDRDVLVALVRRELPQEQARLVYWLIYAFKSWSDAHNDVLVEEFRSQPK